MQDTYSEEALAGSELPNGEISLSLREHNIGFTLPFGARMEGRLLLPCGALIYGDFVGDIFCESGSVVIKKGGRFRGMMEANMIYVEGEVSSLDERRRSTLIARKMIAGSSSAKINADIYSQTFAMHKAKVWGALHSLEESANARKANRALGKSPVSKPTTQSNGSAVAKR